MPKLLKSVLTHIGALALFLVISLIYFSPEMDNKMLPQSDVTQYQGGSQELRDYYFKDGEHSTWTNSMFSGMPSYQLAVWGGSPNFLDYVEAPVRALGNSVGPVFLAMALAYLLFVAMGMNPILSIIGAIGYSLGSYNIIILEAGHITKAWALAYLPLVVAGLMVMFRKKYLLGGVLMAVGLALQIKSNHLQITYYAGIFCAFLFVALAIELVKEKKINELLKASGILVIAIVLALLCNIGNTYANYEMSKESMRGKSELTAIDSDKKQSTGLDKDYAFAWSYGKTETISLLIPNIHGGASGGMLGTDSHLYKALKAKGNGQMTTPQGVQAYTYWGDQPFTSGPVYFGAIVCFLFLLGILVIRSRVKWTILAATVFFIFLSWGKNFDAFNDFMFHYLPMYNKFRTVSMALVIPALSMLIIAIWGLKEMLSGEIDKKKAQKSLYIATGVTAGLALLFWLMPGFFFNFTAGSDEAWKSQLPDWFYKALLLDRKEMLSSDGLRSFIFIVFSAGALYLGINTLKDKKNSALTVSALIAILVLIDLYGVDRRYLNDDSFVDSKEYEQSTFSKSVADESILADKEASYRVLNTLVSPFNDARTSYYHKSIGGYHAAKLKRYQELIEHSLGQEVQMIQAVSNEHLKDEITKLNTRHQQGEKVDPMDVVRAMQDSISPYLAQASKMAMLNTKYIIYHPDLPALQNPYALGNAWFVEGYKIVDNADAEMEAIKREDVSKKAIIDKRFAEAVNGLQIAKDSTASIQLVECKPNYLKYKSSTNSEQLAVMSEIYYAHGWNTTIDGKPTNHIRADWTLRAMRIPAGEHEIEFKFEPSAYNTARGVATASSAVLILLAIGYIVTLFIKKEKTIK